MKDEKCIYFKNGDCSKGLAGTPCELNGCVAHTTEASLNAIIEKAVSWLRKSLDGGMWVDQFLSNSDKEGIITHFREWMEDEQTEEEVRYKIDIGKRNYELLLKAVEFGATWMDENGYSEDFKNMLILLEKLKKVKE